MNRILRLFLLIFAAMFIYQYRYRLMNVIFGVRVLRSFLVKNAFRIPGLREKIISNMF